MYKIYTKIILPCAPVFRRLMVADKTQIIMRLKLMSVILLATFMQVSANGFAQRVSLTKNNISLEQLFTEIRKQTGYNVLWSVEQVDQQWKMNANFNSTPIEEVLEKSLKNYGLTYVIDQKTIVIKSRAGGKTELTALLLDVKGKVTDESGNPLPGAVIRVKNGSIGSSAGTDGSFALKGVPENSMLSISYIGYQTQEVKVEGSKFIQVSLKPSMVNLDQVQVVSNGYQTIKRQQLTGAFATLSGDDYKQSIPVNSNVLENMEGKLAGLVMNVNASGSEDSSPISIRGVSTFNAVKSPLIVLNGFPTEISLESINPYDVVSVTVLKDAAAAAIYGVRASNGVIIIMTKKGTEGAPKFQLNSTVSFKPKPNFKKLDLLTGRGFVDLEASLAKNNIVNNFMTKENFDFEGGTYTPVYGAVDDLLNGVITQEQADAIFNQYAAYDNTKDYQNLFQQNRYLRALDLNASGGTKNATYFFGVNRVDNDQLVKGSTFNKTTLTYRGSMDFLKVLSLDVQGVYSNTNDRSPTAPDYMAIKPYEGFLDENGTAIATFLRPYSNSPYFGYDGIYGSINADKNQQNIAMGLYDGNYYPYNDFIDYTNETKGNNFRFQGNLKAKITKDLNVEIGGAFEKGLSTNNFISSELAYENRMRLNYFAKAGQNGPEFRIPKGGSKQTNNYTTEAYTIRAQATYSKLFNDKHDLSLLAGVEQRKMTYRTDRNTLFGYDDRSLTSKPFDAGLLGNYNFAPDYMYELIPLSGYLSDYSSYSDFFNQTYRDDRFVSAYANGAYTFNHKYSLTGSLRIDQSNLFGSDPKFRYTPLWSAGAAWNIKGEDFLKDVSWLDELKLRVATGYNGNIIKLSGPYNILNNRINSQAQPEPILGYYVQTPANSGLRWEKTINYNFGLDFGVGTNRISGSIDYYIKHAEDVFSYLATDATKGFSNQLVNNAEIMNKGLELNLRSVNILNDHFSWSTQLTASFNKNEVLKYRVNTAPTTFNQVNGGQNVEGYPLNSLFTYNYKGLNELGQPMVDDGNGNNVILRNNFGDIVDIPLSALHYAGTTDPKYVLGLTNQFRLGSFDLSMLFMYYGGHVARIAPPNYNAFRPINGAQDFWKQAGDELTTRMPGIPVYGTENYFDYAAINGYTYATEFVKKMDFIALRNVTLTYKVNPQFSKKLGLDQTKLAIQVQNPYKYVFSGNDVDPETIDFRSGIRNFGVVPAYTFSLTTNF